MTSATERVGRYQLLEPIGVGPSGSVSRAKVFGVAGFERQFAVKRFHHELTATPPMASALSAAARAYGSLEHPRIARMSEFGVAQGTTFTAVEYVAGLDALRLIAEAKMAGNVLAAGGALALVSQAARAVGYAHGRGLTHLGLAPTNVIVTSEGDIKITDFGILSASMPPKPIETVRLAHRIQYLAPEQLANEATSAATDVFALGVLAYELVTGQRTFRGETPAQIAQSVMAGPPTEPPLPRPIVRVLQRCLARSPFERFPDARALADALDAALRVAPVPGTRKDIGAQVTTTLDRINAMNEGELSGMLAVDIGTGPINKAPEPAPIPSLGRDSQEGLELSTLEFVRPDTAVPGPTPLVGPASLLAAAEDAQSPSSTVRDVAKPFTTVPGLAPPPIPVPQGIATPPPGSLQPSAPTGTTTLLGVPSLKSQNPPATLGKLDLKGPKKLTPVPAIPLPPRPHANVDEAKRTGPRPERPSALMRAIDEADIIPPSSIGTEIPPDLDNPHTDPGLGDFSSKLVVEKHEATPLEALEQAWQENAIEELPHEAHATAPKRAATPPPIPQRALTSQPEIPTADSMPPPLPKQLTVTSTPQTSGPLRPSELKVVKPSRAPWIVLGVVVVAGLAGGGWFVYNEFIATPDKGSGKVVTPPPTRDAAVVAKTEDAAAPAKTEDAAVVAKVEDAAPAKVDDAAVAVAPTVDAAAPKPTPSDQLIITSTPSGARVFLDGADAGSTPLKQPGSPDRHTIAVLLPNHELYVAQVDGQGQFAIPLKEVTPMGGPAGIKVTRCKDKDRYYVFVDGKPTGMTCPTERIEVELGAHVVEVYDVVSDSRKKFEIEVTDTRLSYRVKVE